MSIRILFVDDEPLLLSGLQRSLRPLRKEWLATFAVPLNTLDALHLAVAAMQGCPFLTADVALAKASARIGVTARLIS